MATSVGCKSWKVRMDPGFSGSISIYPIHPFIQYPFLSGLVVINRLLAYVVNYKLYICDMHAGMHLLQPVGEFPLYGTA